MRIENEIFYCEHLLANNENSRLISIFQVSESTGLGLETYLKQRAVYDETHKDARTYLVKDKTTHELVGYFSLKAGMVSTSETKRFFTREFDSVPGIELANFAVNGNYKKAHSELEGIGKIIFIDFILPICKETSKLIGAKFIYIFALPYKKLIEYYKSMNFSRLSLQEEINVHKRIRPRYDNGCIFMSRSIETAKQYK